MIDQRGPCKDDRMDLVLVGSRPISKAYACDGLRVFRFSKIPSTL